MNRRDSFWIIAYIAIPATTILIGYFMSNDKQVHPQDIMLAMLFLILTVLAEMRFQRQSTVLIPFESIRKFLENIRKLKKDNSGNQLFNKVLEDKVEKIANQVDSDTIYCLEHEIADKGKLIMNNLKEGGFATFLAEDFGDYWNTMSDYFELCRDAVRVKKKKITRVFICEKKNLTNFSLLRHISEDKDAGIDTKVVVVGEVVEANDKGILEDFGIWDSSTLCIVRKSPGTHKAVGCEYTTDKRRLDLAKEWQEKLLDKYAKEPEEILKKSSNLTITTGIRNLKETAPKMEELSHNCRSTFLGGSEPCQWYHSAWQYLRVLDKVSTPDWHSRFYRENLVNLLQRDNSDGKPKILICGTADYGMLSHVYNASNALGMKPEITVLDMCTTPIETCKWFANKNNFTIQTICNDVMSADLQSASFDAIVTDAFLTRFAQKNRENVVKKWGNILKPKGVVITTVRTSDSTTTDSVVTFSEDEIKEYVKSVEVSAGERAFLLLDQFKDGKISTMALNYAKNISSYPFHGENEANTLFREFKVTITENITKGELKPITYLQILAEKS